MSPRETGPREDGDGAAPGGGLIEAGYWDGVHGRPRRDCAPVHVRIARRVIPPAVRSRMRSYEDYLLWSSLYPRYLPRGRGLRVVEIGSAPGDHLIRMRDAFGWEPFGIERSPAGAALNRARFAAAGIDPRRVIEGDLFDGAVVAPLAGSFDVVVSRGFIEHFPDPAPAIDRHLDLLAPGGTLVVSIPNMRGANYLQALLLNRAIIPLHNREIMRPGTFAALFRGRPLETLFAGHYGTCNAGLFIHASGPVTRGARLGADAVQALLNLLMRALLGRRGLESSLLSPNLLFIGRRNNYIS